jgi:hypothetical protein
MSPVRTGDADHTWPPAHACANGEAVFGRHEFKDLAELRRHALGNQLDRFGEKHVHGTALKGKNPEVGKDFLLPDAPIE